jgi:hypothetical protein
LDQDSIAKYIADTFNGVDFVVADANAFFFYDPGGSLPPDRRFPFATLVTNDLYDQFSDLDRPSVFRLNLGVGKETYRSLFGSPPSSSDTGDDGAAGSGHDYRAFDRIMSHPVYARMHWVCVLNPSVATFNAVRPLLAEAYDLAARRHARSRRVDPS